MEYINIAGSVRNRVKDVNVLVSDQGVISGLKKCIDKMVTGNLIAPVSPQCSNPEEFSWKVLEST